MEDDDKENLPATHIDDVKISIIEDEPDRHVSDHKPKTEKTDRSPKPSSEQAKVTTSAAPQVQMVETVTAKHREHDSQKKKVDSPKEKEKVLNEPSQQNGEPQKNKSAENKDTRKNESQRKSREPEPIHIHMGRTDTSSNSKQSSHSPSQAQDSSSRPRESPGQDSSSRPRESPGQGSAKPRESPSEGSVEHRIIAPNPQIQQLQATGTGVTRTPSFQKKRESQKRRSQEHLLNIDSEDNNVQHGTGTSGTLSDLKKQRAEQHKFGNGLDAQVQSLFLHSLSDAGKKYSSSGVGTQPPSSKDHTQNGKNVKNNNNNTSGQSRPPTYISDSGPLRRFSAPTSHPVGGDDDKFRNDCCVIL